jgi:hypothetical protein
VKTALGFMDAFRRDQVVGTRILICATNPKFDELTRYDAEVYQHYYSASTFIVFSQARDLISALGQGYDVVHLLCDVNSTGNIEGSDLTGAELMERCCDSGVKLLWIASDNDVEGYISGFKTRGKHLNLVMTLKRNDPHFSDFLGELLSRMSEGDTMPVAWSDVCPQVPGSSHAEVPESIFFAGRGGVRLQ